MDDLFAYFDDELTGPDRVRVEQSAERLPERLACLYELRQGLRAIAPTPPVDLEAQLKATLSRERQAGWMKNLLKAAVMIVLLGGGAFGWHSLQTSPDVLAMVEDHLETMPPNGTLLSNDRSQLETWLGPRVGFTFQAPSWSWAAPISGRLCWIRGRKVARLRYRLLEAKEEFSVFVFPGGGEKTCRELSLEGCRAYHYSRGPVDYVVVFGREDFVPPGKVDV